ncbi:MULTISPECIES: hypothetical protein [unclassified Minwuia]|uniref:tyrosine-protein kinase family protein n=1 Tax=unclassified Minwuia TaxID=2618799 RepID=UPI00247989AF|nr:MULTISPECIES: hypothetical protein [unclassified Minwuia]
MGIFRQAITLPAPTSFPLDHTELDHLGAQIAQAAKDGHPVRVLVTGPGRGTGSSTLAWALAQRAALEGQRVLFLDLDPLVPFTQHVLALDTADEIKIVGTLISRPWSVPGRQLDVACVNTAIAAHANRSEIGGQLADELDRLSMNYDLVVADSAPVAARRSTGALDGCAVAARFHLTFVTALSGMTNAGQLETVITRLAKMGARVGGIVLNERDMERPLEGLLRRAKQVAARWPWMPRLLGIRSRTAF